MAHNLQHNSHIILSTLGAMLLTTGAGAMQATPNCPANWVPVFGGAPAPNNEVVDLTVWNDGTGSALYACGYFTSAGGTMVNGVLKWDGTSVTALGTGPGANLSCLAGFDDGTGPALYAATGSSVHKWNGTSWTSVGVFDFPGSSFFMVYDMVVFDDGSGSALYAVGYFTSVNGQPATSIARWNGTNWTAVGGGFNVNDGAFSTLVFDDGTGPALYVGGTIGVAGGMLVSSIAKWNGTSWSAVGSGPNHPVLALAAYDDGTGLALHAGGFCLSVPACVSISKWNGATWGPVGGGMNNRVQSLTTFDDGTGNALYAGGLFTTAGGGAAIGIAKWNGTNWASLGTSVIFAGQTMATIDFGFGPELYVGGSFSRSPAGDARLAKLGNVCGTHEAYCFGDGSGSACPCSNFSNVGSQAGCANSQSSAGLMAGTGSASISGDTYNLYGTGMPDGGALYFQGTARVNGGAGAVFGDGLLCVGGSIVRLAVKFNLGDWSQFPEAGDPTLSHAGLVTAPGTRNYQVWYRDAPSFCTSATYNLTNAWELVWFP